VDDIVNENLHERFMQEIKINESKMFFSIQSAIETVHMETYTLFVHELIRENDLKQKILNDDEPGMKNILKEKFEWANK